MKPFGGDSISSRSQSQSRQMNGMILLHSSYKPNGRASSLGRSMAVPTGLSKGYGHRKSSQQPREPISNLKMHLRLGSRKRASGTPTLGNQKQRYSKVGQSG